MKTITDSEYLARPLIEGIVYTIESGHVRIACPHTTFANEKRIIPENKQALLSLYKKIVDAAKSQSVKISYKRRTRNLITERWTEYENACRNAGIIFDSIVETAKSIQTRGIHSGFSDDAELGKLTAHCHRHIEYHWSSNIVSQISEIAHDLQELDRTLSLADPSLYMIYI